MPYVFHVEGCKIIVKLIYYLSTLIAVAITTLVVIPAFDLSKSMADLVFIIIPMAIINIGTLYLVCTFYCMIEDNSPQKWDKMMILPHYAWVILAISIVIQLLGCLVAAPILGRPVSFHPQTDQFFTMVGVLLGIALSIGLIVGLIVGLILAVRWCKTNCCIYVEVA